MEVARALIVPDADGGSALPGNLRGIARQFLPIANEPVLFHNLKALRGAGIRRVALAVDRRDADEVRDAVGDGRRWDLEATLIEVEQPSDVAAALRAAADFLEGEPVVVQSGDALLRGGIASLGSRFTAEGLDALIFSLAADGERARLRLVDHQPSRGPSFEAATGCLLGPRALAEELRAGRRSPATGLGGLVERLQDRGGRVGVERVDGCLPFRDGSESLLAANRQVLASLRGDVRHPDLTESEVEGPVVVDDTAVVHKCLLRGPIVIGPGARLSDAYVGPYTSIGRDVSIEGAEIEHSIVLRGAQIRFIHQRIASSVIGCNAQIVRSYAVPRALRLVVSDGAEIVVT